MRQNMKQKAMPAMQPAGIGTTTVKPVAKTKSVATVLPPKAVPQVKPAAPNKLPPNTRHKNGSRGIK